VFLIDFGASGPTPRSVGREIGVEALDLKRGECLKGDVAEMGADTANCDLVASLGRRT
jgi:hypothetical protein